MRADGTPSAIKAARTAIARASDSRRAAEGSSGSPDAYASTLNVVVSPIGAACTTCLIESALPGLRSDWPLAKVRRSPAGVAEEAVAAPAAMGGVGGGGALAGGAGGWIGAIEATAGGAAGNVGSGGGVCGAAGGRGAAGGCGATGCGTAAVGCAAATAGRAVVGCAAATAGGGAGALGRAAVTVGRGAGAGARGWGARPCRRDSGARLWRGARSRAAGWRLGRARQRVERVQVHRHLRHSRRGRTEQDGEGEKEMAHGRRNPSRAPLPAQ
jgi:hypothetical protein